MTPEEKRIADERFTACGDGITVKFPDDRDAEVDAEDKNTNKN